MVGFSGFLILALLGGGVALYLGVPPVFIGGYVVLLVLIGALTGFSSEPSTNSSSSNDSRSSSNNNSSGIADAASGVMDGLSSISSNDNSSRNTRARGEGTQNERSSGPDAEGSDEIEDVEEEVEREREIEREELELDEEILKALNDALRRFEDLRPFISELKQVSDNGKLNPMDVGAVLNKHNEGYEENIREEVEQLRDDLGTIIEDLKQKNHSLGSQERIHSSAENHLDQIAQNQLADLQNVVNAIDQASQQNVEVASNFGKEP